LGKYLKPDEVIEEGFEDLVYTRKTKRKKATKKIIRRHVKKKVRRKLRKESRTLEQVWTPVVVKELTP
jgi:hypothetical protein